MYQVKWTFLHRQPISSKLVESNFKISPNTDVIDALHVSNLVQTSLTYGAKYHFGNDPKHVCLSILAWRPAQQL